MPDQVLRSVHGCNNVISFVFHQKSHDVKTPATTKMVTIDEEEAEVDEENKENDATKNKKDEVISSDNSSIQIL